MIFIISYLPKNKSIGPGEYKQCPNCEQELYFLLSEDYMELQIFFLPLFKHQRKLKQTCPNCGKEELILAQDYSYYRALAQLQEEALNGLPLKEYEERIKEIKKP